MAIHIKVGEESHAPEEWLAFVRDAKRYRFLREREHQSDRVFIGVRGPAGLTKITFEVADTMIDKTMALK